jgi:chitinase
VRESGRAKGSAALAAGWLALAAVSVPAAALEAGRPVVVGYVFPRDGPLRQGEIAARKLTHVNYAFVEIRGGRVVEGGPDEAADLALLTALRKDAPGLRVLASVGGWLGSKGFSALARSAAGRARFAASAVEFLRRHDLDGLDVDWEYPGQPGAGNPHGPQDRASFTALLAELRAALDRDGQARGRPLLLTIAAAASAEYLEKTEMAKAQASLDLVNLMTYDFLIPEGGDKAGHHANLRAHPRDPEARSAEGVVRAYLAAGVPAAKLVLGVPFYGRAWAGLDSPQDLYGRGRPVPGFDASYGALAKIIGKAGWVRGWDAAAQAPYLWNAGRHTFVTYDDPESLRLKCRYVRAQGLAGVMFWEYHADPTGALLDALEAGLRADP